MYLMLSKTISSTGKTSDVRYIALSYEGSHESADGIAQHMREWLARHARLSVRVTHDPD